MTFGRSFLEAASANAITGPHGGCKAVINLRASYNCIYIRSEYFRVC